MPRHRLIIPQLLAPLQTKFVNTNLNANRVSFLPFPHPSIPLNIFLVPFCLSLFPLFLFFLHRGGLVIIKIPFLPSVASAPVPSLKTSPPTVSIGFPTMETDLLCRNGRIKSRLFDIIIKGCFCSCCLHGAGHSTRKMEGVVESFLWSNKVYALCAALASESMYTSDFCLQIPLSSYSVSESAARCPCKGRIRRGHHSSILSCMVVVQIYNSSSRSLWYKVVIKIRIRFKQVLIQRGGGFDKIVTGFPRIRQRPPSRAFLHSDPFPRTKGLREGSHVLYLH